MDVSIIILNFNTLDLTRQALYSLYEKTVDCTFEVIVVDNNSDDKPETLKDEFPDIIMIFSEKNLGFAGGNNLGIKSARGDYILLLNSDVILKNDAISIVWKYLRQNRKVAVASAKLEFPDGKLQHVCQRFPSAKYLAIELFRFQKLWSKQKRGEVLLGAFFDHKTSIFSDWVWGTFFMFSRQRLSELPGSTLPEDFFMYYEDVQWCKEFQSRGYKIAYVPEAEVIHFMEGSGGSKQNLIKKNEEQFLSTYYSPLNRWLIKVLSFLLHLSTRSSVRCL